MQYRIKLDSGQKVLGYAAGKLRQNRVRIIPQDRVAVELSPYDTSKGRVTFRYEGVD